MDPVKNTAAGYVVADLVAVINTNRAYLSEIDGLIGDGDHGINMSKGFTAAGERLKVGSPGLTASLSILGETLLEGVRRHFREVFGIVPKECDSLAHLVRSQIGLDLPRILAD